MGFFDTPIKTPTIPGKTDTGGFFDSGTMPFIRPTPVEQPSFASKALTFGKNLVKGIVEPAASTIAAPIQLGAELSGMTAEQVDAATKNFFGDWVAPTAKTYADIPKAIGRGIQTVALGGVPGISSALGQATVGGAAFGLGQSMEQGNPILSK